MTEISRNPVILMGRADLQRSEAPPPLIIPFIVRRMKIQRSQTACSVNTEYTYILFNGSSVIIYRYMGWE